MTLDTYWYELDTTWYEHRTCPILLDIAWYRVQHRPSPDTYPGCNKRRKWMMTIIQLVCARRALRVRRSCAVGASRHRREKKCTHPCRRREEKRPTRAVGAMKNIDPISCSVANRCNPDTYNKPSESLPVPHTPPMGVEARKPRCLGYSRPNEPAWRVCALGPQHLLCTVGG